MRHIQEFTQEELRREFAEGNRIACDRSLPDAQRNLGSDRRGAAANEMARRSREDPDRK